VKRKNTLEVVAKQIREADNACRTLFQPSAAKAALADDCVEYLLGSRLFTELAWFVHRRSCEDEVLSGLNMRRSGNRFWLGGMMTDNGMEASDGRPSN
jgi:hypothetical protein